MTTNPSNNLVPRPTPIGLSVKFGVHNARSVELRTQTAGDHGEVKWLDFIVEGDAHSRVEVTIHAGANPPLWDALCALERAWEGAQAAEQALRELPEEGSLDPWEPHGTFGLTPPEERVYSAEEARLLRGRGDE